MNRLQRQDFPTPDWPLSFSFPATPTTDTLRVRGKSAFRAILFDLVKIYGWSGHRLSKWGRPAPMDSADLIQFQRLIISAASLATSSFVAANYPTTKNKDGWIKIFSKTTKLETIWGRWTTSSECMDRLACSGMALPLPRAKMLEEKMKVPESDSL